MSRQFPIDLEGLQDDEEYHEVIDSADEEISEWGAGHDFITIDDDGDTEGAMEHEYMTFPDTIELESYTLSCGEYVKVGDTVELKRADEDSYGRLVSGDFLKVKQIVEDRQTEKISLCGYRLRRTAYDSQVFGKKSNELFMFLQTRENDPRAHLVQALEHIPLEQVLRKRHCVYTDKALPSLKPQCPPPNWRLMTQEQLRRWVFFNGRLVCRWTVIATIYRNTTKCYEERKCVILKQERDADLEAMNSFHQKTNFKPRHTSEVEAEAESSLSNRSKRVRSNPEVQVLEGPPKRPHIPQKPKKYSLADFFCGAGGVSRGATDAGWYIRLGLEIDPVVMQSWAANNPTGLPLLMDIHDLVEQASRSTIGADHAHFSSCCQAFSIANTRGGKNDEKNIATLYAIIDVLAKGKYATFSVEQVPGLFTHPRHRNHWDAFQKALLEHGYDFQWKILDLAEYGVPQHRRRMLVVGAKRGIPLPPFPAPTHGPAGSGLKPFVTVWDALEPLRRFRAWPRDMKYHQPGKTISREPYDPKRELLSGCITKDGGTGYHWSGTRRFTACETWLLQGFPLGHQFSGTPTQAIQQAGNAVPPPFAATYMLVIAATREAFDHGLIAADEFITDLYETLKSKGIVFAEQLSYQRSLFGEASAASASPSPYIYVNKILESKSAFHPDGTLRKRNALFGRNNNGVQPEAQRRRRDAPSLDSLWR